MRLHDKNNAVHLLVEGGSGKLEISDHFTEFHAAAFFIREVFPGMRPAFRKSIQFLCKPFYDAYLKTKDKLLAELQKELIRKSGTLIHPVDSAKTMTVFYDLETKFDGKEPLANGQIAIFGNTVGKPFPMLTFYTHIKDNDTTTYESLEMAAEDSHGNDTINEVLGLLLFIKYCQVETKIVAKGNKIKHADVDYFNNTELPIEILDSTWFTTIVRSEGFSVGGHFRLQPFGPGNRERKLKWIAPYEKTGYVRKAGVLRDGDRTDSRGE